MTDKPAIERIKERRKAFLAAKRDAAPSLSLVPKVALDRGDVRYWQVIGKYRELGARNRRDALRLIQGGAA